MTPNKQKLIERLLNGGDDLFTAFVIAGLEESLEIIYDEVKKILSMDHIREHRMADLIGLRADGLATIRILKYYGAGDYPVAAELMAKAHIRIYGREYSLRATEQTDMSQEDDAQPIPALKEAQERTKGLLTEADAEMSKHFVEMADRIEELEAKLAKAVEALGTALSEMVDYADTHPAWSEIWEAREAARTTLAELRMGYVDEGGYDD